MNIIFAAIAIYIIFKLKQQFGKIKEDNKRNAIKKYMKEKTSHFSDLTNAVRKQPVQNSNQNGQLDQKPATPEPLLSREEIMKMAENEESDKIMKSLSEDLQKELVDILRICQMSLAAFINMLNKTLEEVLVSFSGGKEADLAKLRNALSGVIYNQFERIIKKRNEDKKILVSKLIAIDSTDIVSASLDDGVASTVIKFTSRQINYLTDDKNNIIEGRKDIITTVTDRWTFKKDFTLKRPYWYIASTNS